MKTRRGRLSNFGGRSKNSFAPGQLENLYPDRKPYSDVKVFDKDGKLIKVHRGKLIQVRTKLASVEIGKKSSNLNFGERIKIVGKGIWGSKAARKGRIALENEEALANFEAATKLKGDR